MIGGDLDTYIVEFNHLRELTGYAKYADATIDQFKQGLPWALH
jgi:hypothetical protein